MLEFWNEYIAEVIGTFILILLGNGVVANVLLTRTKGYDGGWIVITFGWGMAVFVAVTAVGNISGAHINPAVSIGLAVAGKFPWIKVVPFIISQFIGAWFGALFVWIVYKNHYDVTEDPASIQATFCTAPAIRDNRHNFLSELIGTFILIYVILYFTEPEMTSSQLGEVKVGLGAIGALPVGLLVFAIGLSLGGTTGYAINPARDLGPRMIHALLPIPSKGGNSWDYAWIPILGPIAGCVLAAGLFYLLPF